MAPKQHRRSGGGATNLLSDFEGGACRGEGRYIIDHRFPCREMLIMRTKAGRGHLPPSLGGASGPAGRRAEAVEPCGLRVLTEDE